MSNDPFDRLRSGNPVPHGSTPPPPMGVADRIVGSRAPVPGWMATVATAALVVIVGGGSVLLFGGNPAPVAADQGTTSTTTAPAAASTTAQSTVAADESPPSTVAAAPLAVSSTVVAYFLVDSPTATGSSPTLIPVSRTLATLSEDPVDEPAAAVGFLLAGPTSDESAAVPAISSAIPGGTELLGLTISDRVATVDLSAPFAAGSGSFAEIARLEQLTYTLTRFADIDGMRLLIEGEPVEVFGGHGIVLDDPVVRTEFDTIVPAIMIEDPPFSLQPGAGGNPLVASGTANVFEATVSATLTDADGLILWEGFTTATCGTGCRGEWSLAVPYSVDREQRGSLVVWEASARDGSQTNVREHPVWLVPADDAAASGSVGNGGPACSGLVVTDSLVSQSALPPEIGATRSAIFDAATACDWDALRSLIPGPFTFSFGGGDDPIGAWQSAEARGEEPMRYLAELLNRPVGIQVLDEGISYYSWPSAFVVPWEDVSDSDREALRPLYGDDDFAVYAEFGGYIGYRVGIDQDGEWVWFVAGD